MGLIDARLAVDQHPVAVENHQLDWLAISCGGPIASRPLSPSTMTSRASAAVGATSAIRRWP